MHKQSKAKESALSLERLKELFLYCPSTGEFIRRLTAGGQTPGTICRNDDGKGYITISIDNFRYFAHRLAFFYMNGLWPDDEIDHINGVRKDNRILNLRNVISQDNAKNCNLSKKNTSGVCGISWHKRRKKWQAYIANNGKKIFLGYFSSKDDAVSARISANSVLGYHENHGKILRSDT